MTLLKKRPEDGGGLRNYFSDFFDTEKFFDTDFFNRRWGSSVPATNIRETDKEFIIEVAAPGLKKEDFKVNVEEHVLQISAEHEAEKSEEEENYTRREYNYASFNRSFQLPEAVNADEIQAKYEDGVLKLTLPKRKESWAKPKKQINIS